MNLVKAESAEEVSKAASKFTRLLSSIAELSNEAEGVVVGLRDVRIHSDIGNLLADGEASISLRFNEIQQAQEIDKKIRSYVKKAMSKKIRIQVEGGVRRPPMLFSPQGEMLYNRVKKLGKLLDIRTLEEHRWSSADICFVDADIPKLDGLGPAGEHSASLDEYILRHSLLDRAALLALLLHDLGGSKRK
jgi:acetylornithine deacetylase/succinyl-diaminopimelate desuccinylase-like protein